MPCLPAIWEWFIQAIYRDDWGLMIVLPTLLLDTATAKCPYSIWGATDHLGLS